jgi:hypothetical protein
MWNTKLYRNIKSSLIGTRLSAGDYSFKPYHFASLASYQA